MFSDIKEREMTVYNHLHANKVVVSTRLETPTPGIPYTVLWIEANIPLTEQMDGYDSTQLASLLDFATATMNEVHAEKVEIVYPFSDQYITGREQHDNEP